MNQVLNQVLAGTLNAREPGSMGPAEAAWRALNPRQQRFVQAYLRCFSATTAAMEAGYSNKRACARVQGHRLMAREDVWTAITYSMLKVGVVAEARSLDAVLEVIRIMDDPRTKTALKLRCARLMLQASGVLPMSRPRRLNYNGVPLC